MVNSFFLSLLTPGSQRIRKQFVTRNVEVLLSQPARVIVFKLLLKILQCLPISHNALDQYFGMCIWGKESDMMKVEGP